MGDDRMQDWLEAVSEDRWDMIDTDRKVAVALSEGATSVDGIDPSDFHGDL